MPCIDCAHGALRDAAKPNRDKALRSMAKRSFVNCTEEQLGAARRNWLASQTREPA